MSDLVSKKCVPCEGGMPPLESAQVDELKKQIDLAWVIVLATASEAMRIRREFKFSSGGGSASGGKNPFQQAMKFVNRVAELAESEGHHPDLHIFYNKVLIELWTHAVSGLSENDFILAAKIDEL